MKNQPNKVTDAGRLPAKAEFPALNGRIQEALNGVEGNLAAHKTCRYTHLQGQACFRCLCLLGLSCPNQ
jgi:hypothetical protein